ncbi:hypothetical protein [Streptomyces hundungensis]|uniref:hypothetical protein n=1 Tax=Streptomyces hundungensis TaxID=1077946 RepID=UPI003F544AEC
MDHRLRGPALPPRHPQRPQGPAGQRLRGACRLPSPAPRSAEVRGACGSQKRATCDKAGNIAGRSTGTSLPACGDTQSARQYNNVNELTSLGGNRGFSYDGDGNEISAASPTGTRTGGQWTPYTQLSALTASGTASTYAYAGADNNDRLTRGSSTFTNAATGMTREGTTGFVREASGTLTGMTSGGAGQYYLTDVQGSVIGLVDASGKRTATYSYGPYGEARTTPATTTPSSAASLSPTPPARRRTPTCTPKATPSTASTRTALPPLSVVDGVVGKIGDAKSLYDVGKDLVSGDVVGAARGPASLAVGVVVGGICEAATGPESGFLSTAGCYAAGELTTQGVVPWLS